jgi:membrane-associated HD superfamily phosphohydrolase
MLSQQKGVRKSLQKMLNEMKKSGNQGLGDLNSISKEMNDIIKDLEEKRYTQSTSNKQKKILSRMLDSQTSMTQRGIDNNRKSESSEQITFENINGMPEDLGQRQSIIFNAMNKALNSGYSRDYQNMIRRYFNSLNQTQRNFLPDTMQNKLPIEIIE